LNSIPVTGFRAKNRRLNPIDAYRHVIALIEGFEVHATIWGKLTSDENLDNRLPDWVRKEQLANSLGDPVPRKGEISDRNAKRINNGIIGDARRSTAELGKRQFDMKVDYAVKQIRELLK
jgi:creatinine amidohydrolase/Fe(II)-dependent formamide hydrolase-like protein